MEWIRAHAHACVCYYHDNMNPKPLAHGSILKKKASRDRLKSCQQFFTRCWLLVLLTNFREIADVGETSQSRGRQTTGTNDQTNVDSTQQTRTTADCSEVSTTTSFIPVRSTQLSAWLENLGPVVRVQRQRSIIVQGNAHVATQACVVSSVSW